MIEGVTGKRVRCSEYGCSGNAPWPLIEGLTCGAAGRRLLHRHHQCHRDQRLSQIAVYGAIKKPSNDWKGSLDFQGLEVLGLAANLGTE